MYTDPVSIINASAQSFGLAYIDTLGFSLVSLMLADALPLTRLNCSLQWLIRLDILLRAATTTTKRRVLQINCIGASIGLHTKERCSYCNC